MYFANELEKLHYFSIFICISRKNVVYLHPQFHAGDVCASSAGVADIFKRRLLTLCSGVFETSQLSKASSGLSNDRCPRDVYILCARTLMVVCVRVRTYRRGLRVVGSIILGNARASKGGTGKRQVSRFFCTLYGSN